MWRRPSLWLLALTGCGRLLGIDDLDGPADAPDRPIDASVLPECTAQRALFLIGGNGGLAWFTLEWPLPAVITGFLPAFSYDDPSKVSDVTSDPAHPLFARQIATRPVWDGLGKNPHPSVFIGGTNETHTNNPQSILLAGGTGLIAAGASHQTSLGSPLPVLLFGSVGPYGVAPGAPAVVNAGTVNDAVNAFAGLVSPQVQQQLIPTAAQLQLYVPANAVNQEINFGTDLAFAANAFRLGLISTIIMPAFLDDPVGAFDQGVVPQRANNLTTMLEEFYSDLATGTELACGQAGQPLSLADNVATVIVGDTPKDSFNHLGWPDGTIGNANWLYLRSNGFTIPGWFGQIAGGIRTNYDPATGALDSTVAAATDTAAAYAATLYAIVRGDKSVVSSVTAASFDGLIVH